MMYQRQGKPRNFRHYHFAQLIFQATLCQIATIALESQLQVLYNVMTKCVGQLA